MASGRSQFFSHVYRSDRFLISHRDHYGLFRKSQKTTCLFQQLSLSPAFLNQQVIARHQYVSVLYSWTRMVSAQTSVLVAITIWFVCCVTSISLTLVAAVGSVLCSSRKTLAAQDACQALPTTFFATAIRIVLYGSSGVVAFLLLVAIYLSTSH